MDTVLGLLGVVVFIPCVVALAAAITWTVVRYTPKEREKPSTGDASG